METSSAEHVLNGHAEPRLGLALIGVNDLPRMWDQLEPLIARACEYSAGECVPQTVIHRMTAGDWHMLALGDAESGDVSSVMVCAVADYPHQMPDGEWRLVRKLDCLLTSGADVKAWMPFEPRMDAWARSMGCVAVRIPRARVGWKRVLAHWTRLSGDCCVMEREI